MPQFISHFSNAEVSVFFKTKISNFSSVKEDMQYVLDKKQFPSFKHLTKLGEATFKDSNELLVFSCKYDGILSERSSRKKQFDVAKKVLKEDFKDGAIFVFYDKDNNFRFSFLRKNYGKTGDQRYSTWKRYTYFVDPTEANKTFKSRIDSCKFTDLENIQEAFSVEKLTKDFYNDLYKWYQWILSEEVGITYPNNTAITEDDRLKLEEQVIRLVTRLLFVWFIKQKRLVPDTLFKKDILQKILKGFDPASAKSGSYYNAILQNLFFATLNKAIEERDFAKAANSRDIKTLYRYPEMFSISEKEIVKLFEEIPFLNGGLFECLDKEDLDGNKYYLDGFSRNGAKQNGNFKHRAFIPNCVFFDEEKGIIPLLERYNFTVEENVPNEVQVALDPELLGNVFENLLGAFNTETKETARKQSGSFYTPKEIVNYMVDESLIYYLVGKLPKLKEETIRDLFESEVLPEQLTKDHKLCVQISDEFKKAKILDPACGSGAFPMGILNRMITVLQKLKCNEKETVYDQKLHLIEECIYGIDVQTIAAQISKLRFFISLIVEQERTNDKKRNYGVLPLPNLETKFVSANTLIGLEEENKHLLDLNDSTLIKLKDQLWEIRREHFYAMSAVEKRKLRVKDEELREKIKAYISENATKPNEQLISKLHNEVSLLQKKRENFKEENWVDETINDFQTTMFENKKAASSIFRIDKNKLEREKIDTRIKAINGLIKEEENKSIKVGFEKQIEILAKWNPYDQNESSPFFDAEWMFGLTNGFDIVIGNPPYIQLQNMGGRLAKMFESSGYKTFSRTGDIYSLFYEKGWQLLIQDGLLCYITSNKWMRAGYGESTRQFFAENTNPILLIDFAGQKIFESATVDTNILLFRRSINKNQTQACVVKELVLNKLSDYIRQQTINCSFNTANSWILLSAIEFEIKKKIEQAGIPLKDWDITINYGIKTGCNEAFIISTETRDRLICEDARSAELIRPILRGRDIQKYRANWGNLHLIHVPWHFPLHEDKSIIGASSKAEKTFKQFYPAIYHHLARFKIELSNRNKAETGLRYEWYALQRWGANYMEDFFKPKIIYPNMTKYLPFYYDTEQYFTNQKCFIITGENLAFLTAFLNSSLFKYCFKDNFPELLGGTRELSKIFFNKIPVIEISKSQDRFFESQVKKIQEKKKNNLDTIADEIATDTAIFDLYNLTKEERNTIGFI